jgi:hypothetical protein
MYDFNAVTASVRTLGGFIAAWGLAAALAPAAAQTASGGDAKPLNLQRLSCEETAPNGKVFRYQLSLRPQEALAYEFPADKDSPVPLERMGFNYSGRWAVTAAGILVEFTGVLAASKEPEVINLIVRSGINNRPPAWTENTILFSPSKLAPLTGVHTHVSARGRQSRPFSCT